jgi:MoxR-like ATPase
MADSIGRAVLGKDHVIRLTLTCLLSEGHLLLEDLPAPGKTMLARALGQHRRGVARADPVHARPAPRPTSRA